MRTRTKRADVAQLTYYIVQAYKGVKGMRAGITADDPRQARDHDHALQLFERYKPVRAGVVAFRRTGNPVTGDFDDAVIVARHGRLPAEVNALDDVSEAEFEG